MPLFKLIFTALLALIFISCNSNTSDKSNNSENYNKKEQPLTKEIDEDQDRNIFPDGEYCADVTYENPNTGTTSEYVLLVDIEDHKLIEIKFPQGHLDTDHFESPELDENGYTSFESDRGYEYEVNIKGPAENCFVNSRPLLQCRGITRAGRRCKRLTNKSNGLCWQHQKQS